jgi:ankyrin repeat protein
MYKEMYFMNIILMLLSLLCIVLVLNFLYHFLLEFGRLTAKDDSGSVNVVHPEFKSSTDLVAPNIPQNPKGDSGSEGEVIQSVPSPHVKQQLFQAAYDALSAENKEAYAEWGSEDKNEHKLEAEDLASYLFLAHWACVVNDSACLEALKAGGANFDIQDNNGSTAAHYAAKNCYTECLEILRAGGANFDVQDKQGCTPAHYAAEENCIECLEILRAGGANFNILSKTDYTPAHCAAYWGGEASLGVLKAGGASFDIQNKEGYTPAHYAAKNGYSGCLKILNGFGANFNLQDYYGATPAHLAAEGCHAAGPRMVCVYDVPNSNGYTPTRYVLAQSHRECLSELKIAGPNYELCLQVVKVSGANFDIKNNKGQTAREVAAAKGINIDEL